MLSCSMKIHQILPDSPIAFWGYVWSEETNQADRTRLEKVKVTEPWSSYKDTSGDGAVCHFHFPFQIWAAPDLLPQQAPEAVS